MAIVDGEKRLTLLDLYNDITGQAWSMFDSEVEDKEEFEQSVLTSIRKSLTDLWNSYKFPFRERTHLLFTKSGQNSYALPIGNIEQSPKGYNVFCESGRLKYNPDCRFSEQKTGAPECFYIRQNKLFLYPVPDKKYLVTIDYFSLYPVLNEDGDEKAALEEETDYINLPEEYQELFECALMPLTMWNYLIASDGDENSSAYKEQYERAYKRLIEYSRGIENDKSIGWRD